MEESGIKGLNKIAYKSRNNPTDFNSFNNNNYGENVISSKSNMTNMLNQINKYCNNIHKDIFIESTINEPNSNLISQENNLKILNKISKINKKQEAKHEESKNISHKYNLNQYNSYSIDLDLNINNKSKDELQNYDKNCDISVLNKNNPNQEYFLPNFNYVNNNLLNQSQTLEYKNAVGMNTTSLENNFFGLFKENFQSSKNDNFHNNKTRRNIDSDNLNFLNDNTNNPLNNINQNYLYSITGQNKNELSNQDFLDKAINLYNENIFKQMNFQNNNKNQNYFTNLNSNTYYMNNLETFNNPLFAQFFQELQKNLIRNPNFNSDLNNFA